MSRVLVYDLDRGHRPTFKHVDELLISTNPLLMWPCDEAAPTLNHGLSQGLISPAVIGTPAEIVSLIGMPRNACGFTGSSALWAASTDLYAESGATYSCAWCGWVVSTDAVIAGPQVIAAISSSTTAVEWAVVLTADREIALMRAGTIVATASTPLVRDTPVFVMVAFEQQDVVSASIYLDGVLAAFVTDTTLPTASAAPVASVGAAVYSGAVRTVHSTYAPFEGVIESVAWLRRPLPLRLQRIIAQIGNAKTYYDTQADVDMTGGAI